LPFRIQNPLDYVCCKFTVKVSKELRLAVLDQYSFESSFDSLQWLHTVVCRQLTDLEYEEICEETLNSITEKLEELADSGAVGEDFDVSFSVRLVSVILKIILDKFIIVRHHCFIMFIIRLRQTHEMLTSYRCSRCPSVCHAA